MKLATRKQTFLIAVLIAGIAAAGAYVYKQQRQSAWDDQVVSELKRDYPDEARERMLAEIYWSKYPDVAADAYFGKNGRLGVYGPREHYRRHRTEGAGRVWPVLK